MRSWQFDSVKGHQIYSPIAQLVERLTVNQNVRGSSPRRGANYRMLPASLNNFKTIIFEKKKHPAKHLAFVQRIGQGSSKAYIGVRFPYAGPDK